MKKRFNLILTLISALALTFLFHNKAPGINLILFESALFAFFVSIKKLTLKTRLQVLVLSFVVITALATIVTHSLFSYIMHFTSLFVFVGMLCYPQLRSIENALALSAVNLFASQGLFFKEFANSKFKGRRIGSRLRRLRIFLIPLLIIVLFIVLYRNSNPVFDQMLSDTGAFLNEKLNAIFANFDFMIFVTFLLALLISNQLFLSVANEGIIRRDTNASDFILRSRPKHRKRFRFNALKNEYRAGIFLLLVLNLFLFILNILDIKHVWFVFEWDGQYLKEFVHRGTYMLILSIVISMVIVLYYFRGNINFYRHNRFLKILSYIWLGQNAVLLISVALRNSLYIKYFALAYKRIGVYIFLVLALFGLITVVLKVMQRKSPFFLIRINTLALLLVLVIASLADWDSFIARYNFTHADRAFLHLDYMATLSDKALPYLDKPLDELYALNQQQKELFPFKRDYMSPEEYFFCINNRKQSFIREWEEKGVLSWNLAEQKAYKELRGN